MKRGSHGKAVENWQRALLDCMYVLEVDGVFGAATEDKTRQFQSTHALEPDGVVGRLTHAAMDLERFSVDSATRVMAQIRVPRSPYPLTVLVDFESLAPLIITRQRLAAWAAQVGHESGNFRYLTEIWGPTPAQLRYEPPHKKAKELGNTHKGDGKRFKGRGPLQVTGRGNYREFGRALELPLEDKPELLAQPTNGILAAAEFWRTRGCNKFVDEGDFRGLTKRINGGFNGLRHRTALWNAARRTLGTLT